MTARTPLHGAVSGAELAARVDVARRGPDAVGTLVSMLAEQGPMFAGRGTNEAERLRGYILASFETAGLPREAVPFVLEELETGGTPYTVAAAARALGGATEIPGEAPRLLVGAIARLRGGDEVVSFEQFGPMPTSADAVTAITELARRLALLGPLARSALADLRALIAAEGETFAPSVLGELVQAAEEIEHQEHSVDACCSAEHDSEADAPQGGVPSRLPAGQHLKDLALESQDGTRLSFSEAFLGRPTALAFFYTRCMNPAKCSLTVTRLARLARLLAEKELDANVAGITYDPAFDRPARLKTYGADRGMIFSSRCRLLRTVGPFDPVKESFGLGVGFGPVTVNRHRLDLVVLDASLAVTERFERRLWQEGTVLEALHGATTAT
jgi:cytochrome oxidase Cu insertion factor (SCO1/SenC/PrrC family)